MKDIENHDNTVSVYPDVERGSESLTGRKNQLIGADGTP